jgi:hypothetical protein
MNVNWLDIIIQSKLFNHKFFGFNKNKKIYKLIDYKKILNKIIKDKKLINDMIENGIQNLQSFLPLFLNKVYDNDTNNPIYLILDNNKNKTIIHKKRKYNYYLKLSFNGITSFIYMKMDKNYYLKMIKSFYPYYTYLNKYSKKELEDIYNKICLNKNIFKNENQSCYIDSLFYALFNNKNKNIQKLILDVEVNNYNSYLYKKGIEIQKELKRIYMNINNYDNDYDDSKEIYMCKNIRRLLQDYYNNYKKNINPKYNFLDGDLISSQTDYSDIFLFIITIILKVPESLKYSINNKIEMRSFVDLFPIDLLISNEKIEIDKYYPKRVNEIFIDDNSKPLKVENIEYVQSPILFIHFNRNYLNEIKLAIPIIPSLKIKMRENKLNLYLNSIVIHYGDVKYGHYITLYECKGIWYKFDDLSSERTLIGSFNNIIETSDYTENIVGLYYS